ncbi:MAG: AAA family ATPase [Nitrospinota bacterium]
MEFQRLIEALSRSEAYPHPVDGVSVLQTHISGLFLAGPYAYKVKKPLNLSFLDFSTLERRRQFCREEVRLNRRLAPGVYLDVLPVTLREGRVRMGGEGEIVDYAVQMKRLPEERTLLRILQRGRLEAATLQELARRIAAFHESAESSGEISRWGRWEVVAGNSRENFEQVKPSVGLSLSRRVFEKIRALTERELERRRPCIESRAERGVPRDTHGDLHLDHVYFFPDERPPGDLVILDCIEFNERFRYADPAADSAFLAMDLEFRGRRDLSRLFTDAYFAASGDEGGREVLPFYKAYRAVVRGKVEGIKAREAEVPALERDRALQGAKSHFLLALEILASPAERPCLVLVGGLPGTGKTLLAGRLERLSGFARIASDVVRKELAGVREREETAAPFGEGIYTDEWNDRTYTACLERAEAHLFEGKRVLVDASFREERRRRAFLEAAHRWGVPVLFLQCEADAELVKARLERRGRDFSDADWKIYRESAAGWEPLGNETARVARPVPNTGKPEEAVKTALGILSAEGLV